MLIVKNIRCFIGILMLLFMMMISTVDAAQKINVVVVTKQRDIHKELVSGLQNALAAMNRDNVYIYELETFKKLEIADNKYLDIDLVVTIGTDVTRQVINMNIGLPILSAAIPRVSYSQLNRNFHVQVYGDKRYELTAIYLDQPIERRLALIKQILPKTSRIAMLLGPNTQEYEDEIRKSVEKQKLILNLKRVDNEELLIKSLDNVLEVSDVMLGVVDPLVFSRVSARNVLLTAYRWRVPLIGISPAYVRAGALAAVYSTPEQIALQLAETIEDFRKSDGRSIPKPQYPKYFSVSINYQIAESMGIQVEGEEELQRRLAAQESEK